MPKEVYIISPSLTMCYHVSFCTSIAFFYVFCLDLVFNMSDFGYACVLYEIKNSTCKTNLTPLSLWISRTRKRSEVLT